MFLGDPCADNDTQTRTQQNSDIRTALSHHFRTMPKTSNLGSVEDGGCRSNSTAIFAPRRISIMEGG